MSIEFEKILNFRDVGKTVNDYLGRKQVPSTFLSFLLYIFVELKLTEATESSGKACFIAQHDPVRYEQTNKLVFKTQRAMWKKMEAERERQRARI